jgi:DtxR family Mn-dependent transcriptional regulator
MTASILIIAVLIGVVLLLRHRANRPARERRRIEDALKHLFDMEYRGGEATLSSLKGVLRLADRHVLALVARMQSLGFVRVRGQAFGLTPAGNRLARQIVRAHRLLERYFADEARLPLRQVHAAAEHHEHTMTPADVERLSADMGHPSVDPHGDPIPTREGHVPPAEGVPLTAWPTGGDARIVQIEDEPPVAFAQILAEGLHVGQRLRVLEHAPDRVVLTDGGTEIRLAPAVAANVFVAPAVDEAALTGAIRLTELPDRTRAEVVRIDDACRGFSRRRLMDLGLTEGAVVTPVLRSFAGDPRAYQVRGTTVALRRDQAAHVIVRPLESAWRETA